MPTTSEIAAAKNALIQSTAGAIPFINDKGEVSMQKVRVKRYVTGKRPEYAPDSSSDEDERPDPGLTRKPKGSAVASAGARGPEEEGDARLRRLREREQNTDIIERVARHRRVDGPEILDEGEDGNADADDESDEEDYKASRRHHVIHRVEAEESSSDEEELDDEEIERRRNVMRARVRGRLEGKTAAPPQQEEDLFGLEEDEKSDKEVDGEGDDDESSEYEEYTDSEQESGPRLKPVFVARKDRVTIQEKELAAQREKDLEEANKVKLEERRKTTIRLVEKTNRQEIELQNDTLIRDVNMGSINTDDENDEDEYETWQARELKRIKRDREHREQISKDITEAERVRGLTEEERHAEMRNNPRVVTNRAIKGRYKFLQRYYHRGAFFMDEEEQMLQRDVAKPTLDDHFDKTVLPKVMQVKNFGRSGRTKYTHLVDQDTTEVDSPWITDSAIRRKSQTSNSGVLKQSFDKPTSTRKK